MSTTAPPPVPNRALKPSPREGSKWAAPAPLPGPRRIPFATRQPEETHTPRQQLLLSIHGVDPCAAAAQGDALLQRLATPPPKPSRADKPRRTSEQENQLPARSHFRYRQSAAAGGLVTNTINTTINNNNNNNNRRGRHGDPDHICHCYSDQCDAAFGFHQGRKVADTPPAPAPSKSSSADAPPHAPSGLRRAAAALASSTVPPPSASAAATPTTPRPCPAQAALAPVAASPARPPPPTKAYIRRARPVAAGCPEPPPPATPVRPAASTANSTSAVADGEGSGAGATGSMTKLRQELLSVLDEFDEGDNTSAARDGSVNIFLPHHEYCEI